MRNAPSVMYPVGRCAFFGRLLAVLALLSAMALYVAWSESGEKPVAGGLTRAHGTLLGVGLWLSWSGLAAWSWHRLPRGRLQWDALAPQPDGLRGPGAWRWHGSGLNQGEGLQGVGRVLDLQDTVLLELRAQDRRRRWVWVERSSDPQHWDALRRALIAHA